MGEYIVVLLIFRTIVIGVEGIAVFYAGTSKKEGEFPFLRIAKININDKEKRFQFSATPPGKRRIETYVFYTSKTTQMSAAVNHFLKKILEKHHQPEEIDRILKDATYSSNERENPKKIVGKLLTSYLLQSMETCSLSNIKKVYSI